MDNKNLSMKMEPNISFKHSISKIQKILGYTEQKKFVGQHHGFYAALGRHHGNYAALGRHKTHDAALGRHNEHYHTPSRCDNSPYPMKYAAHLLLSNIGPPM